jgi:phosphatidylserine/phosphatidylglycerophosphate/cardiolipin synthase-like enzyme
VPRYDERRVLNLMRSLVFALAAAIISGPSDASAFFSLPTGPSEKGDTAAVSPPAAYPGTVPASVKVLADRDFQAALESEIAAARSEITVVAYLFAAKEAPADRPRAIADRLAEAAGRGVKVEVILEIGREQDAVTRANREAARMLGRRGVRVFVDNSGTTVRARFVVIDRRLVFSGSHDLTEKSLGQYRELSLLAESPDLATSLLGRVASLKPEPYAEAPPRRPLKRTSRSRPSRKR